jgi:hypothetical protein
MKKKLFLLLIMVLVLSLVTIPAFSANGDPVQWMMASGGNGHWYQLSPRPVDGLDDAIELAASTTWLGQSGYVVSILSEGEKDFLVDTFGSEDLFLIGYTDRDEEGTWSWVSGEPSGYEFWASGEPNNFNDEDYAVMNWQHEVQPEPQPPGAWNDLGGFSGFAIFEYEALAASIDISPESCPNPLNVDGKGVLPVAILGTADFDVNEIDPASVRLEGIAPLRWSWEDVATPYEPWIGKEGAYDCNEFGPDGYVDLTLKFDAQEILASLGPVSDNDVLVLQLTGKLKDEFGGTAFFGEDVVKIIKNQ